MKIFVDSSNLEEIKTAFSWYLCEGVTTNPSSLGRLGKDPYKTVKAICHFIRGPVSMQVTSTDTVEMIREGKKIAQIAKNIVVKVASTRHGLNAIYQLSKSGIKVNATNLFTPIQALVAARNGASFVSCWIGRSDDIYMDGLKLVSDTKEIFENYQIKTKIIAASVKNIQQVVEIAKRGADIATIPFDVIEKMTQHPMTDMTFEGFLKDWKNNPALKNSSR